MYFYIHLIRERHHLRIEQRLLLLQLHHEVMFIHSREQDGGQRALEDERPRVVHDGADHRGKTLLRHLDLHPHSRVVLLDLFDQRLHVSVQLLLTLLRGLQSALRHASLSTQLHRFSLHVLHVRLKTPN